MIRKEAVKLIVNEIGNYPIISANGFLSRDLFEMGEKASNFYMIGSMGLASSIGLGVSLKNPKKRVYVFDGDGNILMNLGSLVTISSLKPKNFVHVVFDNGSHDSTGGQPTNSSHVDLGEIAQAAKIKTYKVTTENQIRNIISKIKNESGPIFIHIKIEKGGEKSMRVDISPKNIKERFMKSMKQK